MDKNGGSRQHSLTQATRPRVPGTDVCRAHAQHPDGPAWASRTEGSHARSAEPTQPQTRSRARPGGGRA